MMPRGEVTLIYASLGLSLGAPGAHFLSSEAYAALVAVVLLTTLATPPALKWSFGRGQGAPETGARTSGGE
jgi:hypothetical protein